MTEERRKELVNIMSEVSCKTNHRTIIDKYIYAFYDNKCLLEKKETNVISDNK